MGATPTARPGRVIGGRYRLTQELGAGGMGRVWKAHDLSLDVDVAVKEIRLRGDVTEQEARRSVLRAEREARHAAKLRKHPNIVAVHDVVTQDGRPWIIMELIEGMSLDRYARLRGRCSPAEGLVLARSLLRALAAADAAGIVHRDVKPQNVMIPVGGDPLLTDFGIAVHADDTTLTHVGVIGSLPYMAPERLRGAEANAKTDLYALGVTLFEVLEGKTREQAAADGGPVHLGVFAPLIAMLTAQDPDDRPTLSEALAMVQEGPAAGPTTSTEGTTGGGTRGGVTAGDLAARMRMIWASAQSRLQAQAEAQAQAGARKKEAAQARREPAPVRWQRNAVRVLIGVTCMLAFAGLFAWSSAWAPVRVNMQAVDAYTHDLNGANDLGPNAAGVVWPFLLYTLAGAGSAVYAPYLFLRIVPKSAGLTVRWIVGILATGVGAGVCFLATACGAVLLQSFLPQEAALITALLVYLALFCVAMGWEGELKSR